MSSFTFQVPGFDKRRGYVEFARTEGIPIGGSTDVHLVKALGNLKVGSSGQD